MTVRDLIEALGQMPPDALVYAYNIDFGADEPVCGLLLSPSDGLADIPCSVTICTEAE